MRTNLSRVLAVVAIAGAISVGMWASYPEWDELATPTYPDDHGIDQVTGISDANRRFLACLLSTLDDDDGWDRPFRVVAMTHNRRFQIEVAGTTAELTGGDGSVWVRNGYSTLYTGRASGPDC